MDTSSGELHHGFSRGKLTGHIPQGGDRQDFIKSRGRGSSALLHSGKHKTRMGLTQSQLDINVTVGVWTRLTDSMELVVTKEERLRSGALWACLICYKV